MLPKEKASKLINDYDVILRHLFNLNEWDMELTFYKPCAMVTIKELINYHESLSNYFLKVYKIDNEMHENVMKPMTKYLEQLKKEIENYGN